MTKYGQPDVFLLIDGLNISGDTFELEHDAEALKEQTDGFGDEWVEESYVGVKQTTLTHRAFYDDEIGATVDALVGEEGNARQLVAGIESNAQNKKVIAFDGIISSAMNRGVTRAELHKIASEYASHRAYEGSIVQPFGTSESGDGPTSAGSMTYTPDMPAGHNETSMIGFLQVLDLVLGGYTSVTIVIQDSVDDAVFIDLITFTDVTVADIAEAVIAVDAVNTFVRTELTWNGAGAAESLELLTALAVETSAAP